MVIGNAEIVALHSKSVIRGSFIFVILSKRSNSKIMEELFYFLLKLIFFFMSFPKYTVGISVDMKRNGNIYNGSDMITIIECKYEIEFKKKKEIASTMT